MRGWGLNTIANWSDADRLMQRTPYTDSIHSRGARLIEEAKGIGKFPDVFDPR
jgi:hypothetical protein